MSIKLIPKWVFLFFLIGCTETEVKQFDFNGDINFKVTTYAEWGSPINDKGDVAITIKGSDPEIKAYTDTAGNCIVKNLPLGTYDLKLEKEGYGEIQYLQFKFIGAEEPNKLNFNIKQKSSIKIKNYTLSFSGTNLLVEGEISHSFPENVMSYYPFSWPSMIIYLSDTPDVSCFKYKHNFRVNSNKDNSTTFNASINLYSFFNKGSRLYAVLYGKLYNYPIVYDMENDRYYDPTQSEPSEIKSIIIL